MNNKYIAVFNSARDVIKCDKKCKARSLNCRIVPVPEKYSSNCGMSIEFDGANKINFESIITEIDIEVKIYEK